MINYVVGYRRCGLIPDMGQLVRRRTKRKRGQGSAARISSVREKVDCGEGPWVESAELIKKSVGDLHSVEKEDYVLGHSQLKVMRY